MPQATIRLYLTRHGETVWNRDGERYCSRTDVPLTERGEADADRLAILFRDVPFDAAVSSPLSRARETLARILAGRQAPTTTDERLREMDYGDWEGLQAAEIESAEPDAWTAWRADSAEVPAGHTGETARQVLERANSFLADLRATRASQTVLVVGHSTLNRVLIAGTLELPLRHYRRLVQSNTAVSVAEVTPGDIRWLCINRTDRLPVFAE